MNDTKKYNAIILGATGAAGQNIVESLISHPWFNIEGLAASKRSSGLSYIKAVEGTSFFDKPPTSEMMESKVLDVANVDPNDYDIAFSALPSEVAKIEEPKYARYIPVISTASAFRYDPDVPILIPDVNPTHARLLTKQRELRGWNGFICPGPNCTTVGLTVSLKPILDEYGIKSVHMVSEQALSGAGEKGLKIDSEYRKSVEMNVMPFIEGEEEKVVRETNKILGRIGRNGLKPASISIGATCTRVYVQSVHTEAIYVGTKKPNTIEGVREVLENYISEPQRLRLPSAPERPIKVLDDASMPQPRLHHNYGGQFTLVGRLRRDPVFINGLTYIVTSDNLDKGAGGGAVLTAEYLKAKHYF